MNSLSKKIIDTLAGNSRQLARELAVELNISRRDINQLLYKMDEVVQDEEFRWSLTGQNMNNKNETDYSLMDDIGIVEANHQKNQTNEPDIPLDTEAENYSQSSENNDSLKKFAFDSGSSQ